MISPNTFLELIIDKEMFSTEDNRRLERQWDKSHYNACSDVSMLSAAVFSRQCMTSPPPGWNPAGDALVKQENIIQSISWDREECRAHSGLMLRGCHDAICTPSPFIPACEAMWLSDNILPCEICVESLWHLPQHLLSPPPLPLGCLFQGNEREAASFSWDMQWLSFSRPRQFTH